MMNDKITLSLTRDEVNLIAYALRDNARAINDLMVAEVIRFNHKKGRKKKSDELYIKELKSFKNQHIMLFKNIMEHSLHTKIIKPFRELKEIRKGDDFLK
jgi:hypothetical protein